MSAVCPQPNEVTLAAGKVGKAKQLLDADCTPSLLGQSRSIKDIFFVVLQFLLISKHPEFWIYSETCLTLQIEAQRCKQSALTFPTLPLIESSHAAWSLSIP